METSQITIIIMSVLTLAGLGFLAGFGLALASKKFHVDVDPRVEKVLEALPGSNCAACGYPSCMAAAEAIVAGKAEANVCNLGGEHTTKLVCNILGVTGLAAKEKVWAVIRCGAGPDLCKHRFEYLGEETCSAANTAGGGFIACDAGCLGFGDCKLECPFNAIEHEKGKLPIIIREKCTGCGKCINACPRAIIHLKPVKQKVYILCSTKDKGAAVRKFCKLGCIGCRICVKQCPTQAITMEGRVPEINPEKCEVKEVCIQKCPTKTIKKL